jgi:hypothetical protein
MSALETLDGLANGTDIGIQTGGRGVDRWRVADGGLEKDGVRLDPWLFSGYLKENRVYLADFSPPQVGEWFTSEGLNRWMYLVMEMEDTTAHCAQFRNEEFFQFQDRGDLVERWHRCPAPDWGTPLVKGLTERLWILHKRDTEARQARDNIYAVQENLRYITSYAERATTTLGRINR